MLRFIAFGALALFVGYAAGLVGGFFAVSRFSPNKHDRYVEAAMTGAFVVGPIVSLASLVAMFAYLQMRGG